MIQFDYNLKKTSGTIYRAYRAIEPLDEETGMTNKEKRLGLVFIEQTLTEALKNVSDLITELSE